MYPHHPVDVTHKCISPREVCVGLLDAAPLWNNTAGVVLVFLLPELVSALRGLLDVVMALEPVGVACVALAAAAKAARFCMALRPGRHTQG